MDYNIESSAKKTAAAYDALDIPMDGSPLSDERTINNAKQSSIVRSERDNLGIYADTKPDEAAGAQQKFWDEVQKHDDPNKGLNVLRSEDGTVLTVPHQLDKAGKKMAELLDSDDPAKLGEAKEFHDKMARRIYRIAANGNPEVGNRYWNQFGKATNFYENNTVGGDRVKVAGGKLPQFDFSGAKLAPFNLEESGKKVAGYFDAIEDGDNLSQAQKTANMIASVEMNAEFKKFGEYLNTQPEDQHAKLMRQHSDASIKHDDRNKGLNIVRTQGLISQGLLVDHKTDLKAAEFAKKLDTGDPTARAMHDKIRAEIYSKASRQEIGTFNYRQFIEIADAHENNNVNGDNLKLFKPVPRDLEAVKVIYKDKPENG